MSGDSASHPARTRIRLARQWQFSFGEATPGDSPFRPDFDDARWQEIRVPHDWAIAGPFSSHVDFQGGYLPFPGVGWYRRRLPDPAVTDRPVGRTYLEFDGVMRDARVWVNGEEAGHWFYGYSSFVLDITDLLRSANNVLAVRAENEDLSSRWYPGSGIYRNVWLTRTADVHIPPWGTRVIAQIAEDGAAEITLDATVRGVAPPAEGLTIRTTILDASGDTVAETNTPLDDAGSSSGETVRSDGTDDPVVRQRLGIDRPVLWDIEHTYCYRAITRVERGGTLLDEYVTPFGVRSCVFDPDRGFYLNGRHVKLRGVNLHHDLGPLGAAVSARAIERQLEIMQAMGANAVRCAHNPPAPELLDLCDRMGLLVIDETFDEWKQSKKENGYVEHFDEWSERDTTAMVVRDRNHPSVILWSIGNEIRELDTDGGKANARRLAALCRTLDPTRPVTSGIHLTIDLDEEIMKTLDVAGLNYWQDRYADVHRDYPTTPLIATESAACLSTRGEYHFPVTRVYKEYRHGSKQITSYDVVNTGFGALPDEEFEQQEHPWMAGEFVWSGFDYHGEPDPYEDAWPAHSSYFGIVDMCGFPKDRYYLYRSRWSDQTVLYLLPHWSWPGRENEVTPVTCYSNADSVELFVNGESAGVRRKSDQPYRFTWDDVVYAPGELRAVGYDAGGAVIRTTVMRTSGEPARIALAADRPEIAADGDDLCFVTAVVTDAEGIPCPQADDEIEFEVAGAGRRLAVGNGDPTSLESYQSGTRRAFHGQCLLIVRSTRETGEISIVARSKNLEDATISVRTTNRS